MAKKTTKKAAKSNELDGKEFFAAVTLIEKEKGIPRHYMLEKITQALVSAYKRDHEGVTDNVFVEANEITETVRMYVKKEIVEEVTNPATEIALAEARSPERRRGPHRDQAPELRPHRRPDGPAGHHPGHAGSRAQHDLRHVQLQGA